MFDLLPMAVSVILAFMLGAVWYGPLFGKYWMQAMGLTKDCVKPEGISFFMPFIASFLGWCAAASVYSWLLTELDQQSALTPVCLAVALWLGFTLPIKLNDVLYGMKEKKLILIDAGYLLAGFLIFAVVFSFL